MTTKKKLIEVALPLDAINAESAREKSIRHGHPSTLHLWWARRPLAACRAVLFSQLVDDPSSHPEQFPTEEAQDAERERLFDIIRELVKWENSTNERVLEAARAEIRKSFDGSPPPILDPFAGGGSIPLEAQRLGLEAYASDLNPVAVLINKALIEIPPRWAGLPPVHPDADRRTRWERAEGLAEDVRCYGRWMRDEAERRIGHLYPKAQLPNGKEATVIAWLWARTVTCPNPACGATMPLVRSFWLGKKKGKEAWIRPVVEGKGVRFEIGTGKSGPPIEGTVGRTGATCLCCGQPVPLEHIRSEGRAGRIRAQLMAVVAEGERQRVYLAPTDEHEKLAMVERPDDVPTAELFDWPGRINVVRYGFTEFWQLFTNRQLVALTTFSDLVGEARERVEADAHAAGHRAAEASAYATAVATYLAFAVSRTTNRLSSICGWDSSVKMEGVRSVFARQALPMVWDYAEANPFSDSSGNYADNVWMLAAAIEPVPARGSGYAFQADAREVFGTEFVASTDPPYYDNIGYADLSDFFYVWLRRSLRALYPAVFATLTTPKAEELVATPYRFAGSKAKAELFFEEGFVRSFSALRSAQVDGVPLTLFYAFKQSEQADETGLASTGWSTMLEGLLQAGLMVTGTWPMRTELSNRILSSGTNALASSVVLACRPRPEAAGITDRRGLLAALKAELPAAVHELQKAAIAPVDLRQAAIGPGMAVFSRYARVVEPNGEAMRVRTALTLINQVLGEVLDEQAGDFDDETRWAIVWFTQHGFEEGPYGKAEALAVSMNVSVDGMKRSGILTHGGGKVRLLAPEDLPDDWDPRADKRTPVWEATHQLVKALETGGEQAAGELLRGLGGLGDSAQLLAYRLYLECERGRPALATRYNALVAAWSDLHRASLMERDEATTSREAQQQLEV